MSEIPMVERVARALTEAQIRSANELFKLSNPRRVKTEEQIAASIESGWTLNAKDARAAIDAMREPTIEMRASYDETHRKTFTKSGFAIKAYRAMIEAALNEEVAT